MEINLEFFFNWLLIGSWHSHLRIGSYMKEPLLTNVYFKSFFSVIQTPGI